MSRFRVASPWLFAACVFVVSPFLVPLTGCGGGNDEDPTPSPSPTPTPTASPTATPTPTPTASPTPTVNFLQVQIGSVLQTLTGAGVVLGTTTDGRQFLRIQGQASAPQPGQITVTIPRPVTTGTYVLASAATNDRLVGTYQVLVTGGINAATFDSGGSGSGSITVESVSDTRISGRFTMAVRDAAFGVTVNITNGTFSLPIQ